MFTRYKGTGIPENYSGVRFREAAQHTEMKTHKPSPSYTSTKTSVSPMFRHAQLQKNQEKYEESIAYGGESTPSYTNEEAPENDFGRKDIHNSISYNLDENLRNDFMNDSRNNKIRDESGDFCGESGDFCGENINFREGVYEKHQKTDNAGVQRRDVGESKKARGSTDLKAELGGLLDKILGGIKSDDFILLAVIFLLLGGEGGASKSAILPLALLLLYS